MKKRIRRLWHGLASLRDYEVQNLIRKNQTVVLECLIDNELQKMTIKPEDLQKGINVTTKKHRSAYNVNQTYGLVDFRWKKDESVSSETQQELF